MTNKKPKMTTGSCFCGAVAYEIKGTIRDVVHCHCSQCTKLNGNFGSHSKAKNDTITITKDEGLTWYQISEQAYRGFCKHCGSALFWKQIKQDVTGIVAGSIDSPTGLKTIGHIFVEEKSDFYEITDNAQQFSASSNGNLEGDYL